MNVVFGKQISVRLPLPMQEMLEADAEKKGITLATLVRMVVVSSLNQISETSDAQRLISGNGRAIPTPARGGHCLRKAVPKKRVANG